MQVRNPYNDAVVETLPDHSADDVAGIIERAYDLRRSFAQMPAHEKAKILTKAADIISERIEEFARSIVLESGKPIRYARGEVKRCIETFTFAADVARHLNGETLQMSAAAGGVGKFGYYVREPVGVVGAITPFNFPLNLVAHKVAPAIAVGCPIVLKPSPMTPLTAIKLAEVLIEAGLPEGLYSVVVGDVEVGKQLTTHPKVAMITFTGSPSVGEAISKVAGLRRTTFELGGNAATIIDEGTHITDALINRLAVGAFAYSGQVCISVQRIYIHESLYDEFRDQFVARTNALVVGDPLDEATEIGPLINDVAGERLSAWLQSAKEQGATISAGGDRDGRMMQATVLENVEDDMQVMCAEAFGPLVNLVPYSNFDAVLDAVNDSDFGLQAGVYTPSLDKAMQAINTLNVGGVMINDVPTFRVDHMPYGGNKKSGVGREGPQFAIEDMTTLKMVVINPSV
ncbi:MAG: aldehyde dehydrogenase family protein [Phototrophicaceae bacterium]